MVAMLSLAMLTTPVYLVTPLLIPSTNTLRLTLVDGQVLGSGQYQLTIRQQWLLGATRLWGWLLDGDGDGLAGGDFVKNCFGIVANNAPSLASQLVLPNMDEDPRH